MTCLQGLSRDECDLWDFWSGRMKPMNAFPYIAMLVIVIALILMFSGYFQ